jgi:hypothetical protein
MNEYRILNRDISRNRSGVDAGALGFYFRLGCIPSLSAQR